MYSFITLRLLLLLCNVQYIVADTYAAWQFDPSLPPPPGLTTSITTTSLSASTTTSSTTASQCTGWCVRQTSLTSDNITYIVTAACLLLILFLVRHDKKVRILVILWSCNIYSFWFLTQYYLWNILMGINIITYRFLYPPGYDSKEMYKLLNTKSNIDTTGNNHNENEPTTFEEEHYMKHMKAKQDRLDHKYMEQLKYENETSEERATRKYIAKLKHKR